ncbi:MAG: hypothetical protein ABI867_16230 [Kofleriaceae bacterium]
MNRTILAGVLIMVAVGCSKKDSGSAPPAKEEPKGSATEPVKDKPKTPEPTTSASVKIDPEIDKRVKAIVASCKVDAPNNSISDCKAGEDEAIFKYALENKDKATGLFESLAEIALTDGAKDPKVLVAVVETWPGFSDHDFEKKASTPAAGERVIKLYDKVNAHSSRWSNAARVPLLAGKHAELAAALAKLGADRAELRHDAYSSFVEFGGMDALADLQAVFKGSKDELDRSAALQAVGRAVHGNALADADKVKACDWVKGVAADSSVADGILGAALDSLSRCGSAYIDAGLAAIEANIKAKHLSTMADDALHHMCWAEGMIGGANNGSKEQCAKAFALLEAGVNAKDHQPASLSQAAFTAEMLGKNSAELKPKAKALLTKLAANADKDVAAAGKRGLDGLK